MLQRFNKTQNLSRRQDVVGDIAFAESCGIAISYGYLFDPCHQTGAHIEQQLRSIAENPLLPMPTYLSVVAPLAGTATFWADLRSRRLAPNLRLRDLDGETLTYSNLADDPEVLAQLIEKIFRRPWEVVNRFGIVAEDGSAYSAVGNYQPDPVVHYCFSQPPLLPLVARGSIGFSELSGWNRHAGPPVL